MARKPELPAADEKQVRRLLDRYSCPVPYHQVRTRFLGNIATPKMSTKPMQVLAGLWGGELPEFDSMEDVNELIDVLINGLWNSLTRHQKRSEPFHLTRVLAGSTRQDLADLALLRWQELDGFAEGMFDGQDVIDLPEKANAAFDNLGALRAAMTAILEITQDDTKAADAGDLVQTFRHVRELTLIMEREINVVVLDCMRARRQMIKESASWPPTTFH